MRYLIFIIIFTSFSTYERKPTRMYLDETQTLMRRIQYKALDGTLDKQRIKQWLKDYDRENKQ